MTTERRRLRPGFRMRVLGVIAVLLVGAVAAGFVLQRAVLRARLDRQVQQAHDQELAEIRRLAGGRDPQTGEPFGADVEAIFDTFLARNIPGADEVYLTFVDGSARRTTAAPARLDLDPDLAATWGSLQDGRRGTAATPAGEIAWLAAPIRAEGETGGVFVVATFLDPQRQEIDATLRVEAVVSAVVLLAVLAIAWSTSGRLLRPVRELTESARRIDERDLSERIPVEGDDEIAELARTYNGMLDRLESAFAAQRRFVDDAGHELRTPITIISGHLELISDDPVERRETLALVSDELDRMSRMVEDLLTLARADQPTFIDPEPTELADLSVGLLARARAMGDRSWVLDEHATGWVEADGQRVVQATLNLVRNAVEHTGPGDEIGIGTRRIEDHLELWVRDRGPGVAPEDRDRLFERFTRGSQHRRRSDGAGLGLAIVAAIAQAHGGTARHDETPGGGATFTITVPIRSIDPPGGSVVGPDDPTRVDPTPEPRGADLWPAS